MQIPTMWTKKLIKLDDIKNLRFKKGVFWISVVCMGKEIPIRAIIPFDLHLFAFFFHQ